jgi:predicted dinucleotide-binding enzyme
MRLAIIGAGSVGATLARTLARAGHAIVFAARDPNSASVREAVTSLGGNARALPIAEAVAGAEVVLLATPWGGAQDALAAAGDFGGRVLVDCTNPLGPDLTLVIGHTTSGGEQVAGWARNARVVKAFNTTGYDNMANPRYPEGAATMFICGDDPAAKQATAHLAEDAGFEVVDCGPLRRARLLEPLAALWISLAVGGLGRDFAFRLIRR